MAGGGAATPPLAPLARRAAAAASGGGPSLALGVLAKRVVLETPPGKSIFDSLFGEAEAAPAKGEAEAGASADVELILKSCAAEELRCYCHRGGGDAAWASLDSETARVKMRAWARPGAVLPPAALIMLSSARLSVAGRFELEVRARRRRPRVWSRACASACVQSIACQP